MDKTKSAPLNIQGLKKEKPVEKEVEQHIEIKEKEKIQPVAAVVQKKKGKKDEPLQDLPKPMNLGFGALGALGSLGTGLSSNANTEEANSAPLTSNFF
jgi:hypothetical protein